MHIFFTHIYNARISHRNGCIKQEIQFIRIRYDGGTVYPIYIQSGAERFALVHYSVRKRKVRIFSPHCVEYYCTDGRMSE